jgi:nucleoside phosphorylase
MIDGYSRQARIIPVLIAALPLVLLGLVALPRLAAADRVVTLVLLAALLPLFDQLARTRGRRCEPALLAAWGGRPTTQLLRWRGPARPSLQGVRHQALERMTGFRLPAPDEEDADPAAADEAYETAVRALRELAGGAAAVRIENRSYGFRRNLFGLRSWGCLTASASLAIMAAWAWIAAPAVTALPVLGVLAGLDLALLALWLAVVREAWVREAAWSYAERLIDQVERLDPKRGRETVPGPVSRSSPAIPGEASRAPAPPTVAILTALACEFAAVSAVLRQPRLIPQGPAGDPNHYLAGELPSRDPGVVHHVVTTVLPYDGNRSAAAVATDVLRSFPAIRCVIFSGIAGGVPDAERPGRGVQLGDVLVAVDGIVDYDHTATLEGKDRLRRHLQGLSADMLRAVQEVRAVHADPVVPLRQEIDRVTHPRFARPEEHPEGLLPATVRVHFGAIGSAERLLRDAARRDQLARAHDIKGMEMEASGLAVGASLRGVPWFVVRGVSDYCDSLKDDSWQDYASLTSAAFVAVLLRHCRPLGLHHPAAAPDS